MLNHIASELEGAFRAVDTTSQRMKNAIEKWYDLYYEKDATEESDPCQRIPYTIVRKLTKTAFSEYASSSKDAFASCVIRSADKVKRKAMHKALVGGISGLKPVPTKDGFRFSVVNRSGILVFARDGDGEPVDIGTYEKSTFAYSGINGSSAVSTVAGVSPDSDGNVTLTAADVGALAVSGGDMTGAINMNGQPISGLNNPTEDTQAANKGYVDTTEVSATLTAAGWVGSGPYTQTITVAALTDGRRCMVYPAYGDDTDANIAMKEACGYLSYTKREGQIITFTCLEDKPGVDIAVIVEAYV